MYIFPENAIISLPLAHLLNLEDVSKLHQGTGIKKFKKKDKVFVQGEKITHIYCVKSGMLKVFKTSRNNRNVILNIASEGMFPGLMSLIAGNSHSFSSTAINDAEVYTIELNVFRRLLLENGDYALQIINLISSDACSLSEKLMSLNHKQLPGRVAELILYFSEEIYRSRIFTFPITRRELAELAGTTKESLIRTLTEFKNDKIIEMSGSRLEIKSMEIIKTLSVLG
jgi:CRP/FNR family transcriptional regulator, polysaccharide utilization system transcription regulator